MCYMGFKGTFSEEYRKNNIGNIGTRNPASTQLISGHGAPIFPILLLHDFSDKLPWYRG